MNAFDGMDRDGLRKALEMFAKNWLANDGCWFLAAEERLGITAAIELDAASWARFAEIEARRIMTVFELGEAGGLLALEKALGFRMYSLMNAQRTEWSDDRKCLRLVVDVCRVQDARRRKGLADFPCKSVGIVEYDTFARAIDPRIRTQCLHCPPDAADGQYCGWEFTMGEQAL